MVNESLSCKIVCTCCSLFSVKCPARAPCHIRCKRVALLRETFADPTSTVVCIDEPPQGPGRIGWPLYFEVTEHRFDLPIHKTHFIRGHNHMFKFQLSSSEITHGSQNLKGRHISTRVDIAHNVAYPWHESWGWSPIQNTSTTSIAHFLQVHMGSFLVPWELDELEFCSQ